MKTALPRPGDLLTLELTELDDTGQAFTRLTWGEGPDARRLRVSVRGAIPGDIYKAEVRSRKRDQVFARGLELLRPSPDRILPPCPHARYQPDTSHCGGCSLQAASYSAQKRLKKERIRRAFGQHSLETEILDTRPAPLTFHHRHKMEFSFGRDRAGELCLGLHPPGYKWEVLSLESCLLLSPEIGPLIPALGDLFRDQGLRAWDPRRDSGPLRTLAIREAKRTDDKLIEIITAPPDADGQFPTDHGPRDAKGLLQSISTALTQLAPAFKSHVWTIHDAQRGRPTRFLSEALYGPGYLTESLQIFDRTLHFQIAPRAFFQPHPRAAEGLVEEVIRRLEGAKRILDLYCGTGTLSLAIAPFVEEVLGIELIAEAVENAQHNAENNGLSHARFLTGDVAAIISEPEMQAELRAMDAIVCDPPRSGLSPKALASILAIAPPKIVYVSCKPESLARDLRQLLDAGYRLDGPAQPIDLFPQSQHIETVVSLSR